jgi:hypothetical protein
MSARQSYTVSMQYNGNPADLLVEIPAAQTHHNYASTVRTVGNLWCAQQAPDSVHSSQCRCLAGIRTLTLNPKPFQNPVEDFGAISTGKSVSESAGQQRLRIPLSAQTCGRWRSAGGCTPRPRPRRRPEGPQPVRSNARAPYKLVASASHCVAA